MPIMLTFRRVLDVRRMDIPCYSFMIVAGADMCEQRLELKQGANHRNFQGILHAGSTLFLTNVASTDCPTANSRDAEVSRMEGTVASRYLN